VIEMMQGNHQGALRDKMWLGNFSRVGGIVVWCNCADIQKVAVNLWSTTQRRLL
jgi:hypothetical protein